MQIKRHRHLIHDTSFPIIISILLRVQLIHQAWLLACCILSGGCTTSRSTKVLVGVVSVSGAVILGQGGGSPSACAAESSTNWARLSPESISALFAAREVSALSLELVHGDGRERASGVVLGLVLVHFVDGNGRVDDRWLDCLLLDNGLDVLVDVVVDVLSCDGGVGRCVMLGGANFASVLELCLFGREPVLDVLVVAVLDVAVLNTG
jgi:hypothetical protein